jgi:WD40 repeat protein
MPLFPECANKFTHATFDPTGRYIAYIGEAGTVTLLDMHSGQEIRTFNASLTTPGGYIGTFAFSQDGNLLATLGSDNITKIWDIISGELLMALRGHSDEVLGLAFNSTGQQLATASRDTTVKLWDIKTGAELHTLVGHTGWVYSVAFSPDGKKLATASQDRIVKIWDVETGQGLITLTGYTDQVYDVAFSPDGRRLATASLDGTVRIYILPIEELMAFATTRVTRDLTCSERVKYLHEEIICSTPTSMLISTP